MMKISRFGILILLLFTVSMVSSCSFYNRVMARKNLVDGAKSYQDRNLKEAEEKFRKAVSYDPNFTNEESKMAQLFLARTIHSEYINDRKSNAKAESAIKEYQTALKGFVTNLKEKTDKAKANPKDEKAQKDLKQTQENIGSIVRAVASLYVNLQQDDKWNEWQNTQSANDKLPNDVRAGAFVDLAAKQYTCANDITDTEATKKTVKEGDKDVFKFSKPESEEDFDKLKKCVEKGTELINKAVELNPESDSAWSYKASLLEQSRRIAEMEDDTAKKDELKKQFNEAKQKFEALAEKKRLAEEAEAKRKAEEEAKKAGRKVQTSEQPAESK